MSLQGEFFKNGMGQLELVERQVKVVVPAASVATLRATPFTIIPAQGAGTVVEFMGGILRLVYGSVAYTESTDNLVLRYTNTTGVIVSQTIEMTGFITLTANASTHIAPIADQIAASNAAVNAPVVLHNSGDGEFGNSGNSSLVVFASYRVWRY